MRLLKRLRSVERSVAAAADLAPLAEVGLVYSAGDVRLDASLLRRGEYLACDMHQLGAPDGMDEVRMVERVTRDAGDLGYVYGPGGDRVGRVTSIDGSLISYELLEG